MRYAAMVVIVIACLLTGCRAPEESDGSPSAPIAAPKAEAVSMPAKAPADDLDAGEVKCLVCGMPMDPKSEMAVKVECADCDVDCYVCRGSCEETYNAEPAKYGPKKVAGEDASSEKATSDGAAAHEKPARTE